MDLTTALTNITRYGIVGFIKNELKKRGITYQQIANELKVSRQAVSNTINCKKDNVSSKIFRHISQLLGLPDELLYAVYRSRYVPSHRKRKKERKKKLGGFTMRKINKTSRPATAYLTLLTQKTTKEEEHYE